MSLEREARLYCRLSGLDPDKTIAHGPPPDENGIALAVLLHSPQWQLVAHMLKVRRNELIALGVEVP